MITKADLKVYKSIDDLPLYIKEMWPHITMAERTCGSIRYHIEDDSMISKECADAQLRALEARELGWAEKSNNDTVNIEVEDLKLLLHLMPEWVKIVPKGLSAEFYGTLSYEGDAAIKDKVDTLVELVNKRGK